MTGIIAAMSCEAELILGAMKDKSPRVVGGMTFWQGRIGDEDVVLATCGVGKVFASACATAMIITYNPDKIINTGVAGGADATMHVLDLFVAERILILGIISSLLNLLFRTVRMDNIGVFKVSYKTCFYRINIDPA